VYYRLVVGKTEGFADELNKMLADKKLSAKGITADAYQKFKSGDITLDIELKDDEVVLLFGTLMATDEFLHYIDQYVG